MKTATQGRKYLGVNIGTCGFIPLVIISAHVQVVIASSIKQETAIGIP